jgi:hypothetical protein
MNLIERRQRILSVRARQTRIARLRLAEAQRRLERLEGTASQLARMAATLTPDQGPTDGLSLRALVEQEKDTYPVRAGTFHLVSTVAELDSAVAGMKGTCDTLFVDSLEGITDAGNAPMNHAQVMKRLRAGFPGPILAGNRYQVEQGAWAAVVKTGQEQGDTSAEMLLKAMRGTPVTQIPIVRNVRGQRVINVTAMEAAGIEIRPQVLRGAALVREQN